MTALSWFREMFGMTAEHSAYERRERGVKIVVKRRIGQFRVGPGGPAPPPVGRGSPEVHVAGNRSTVAAGNTGPAPVSDQDSQSTFAGPVKNVHPSWSGP